MNYTIANLEKDYEVELDELGVKIKELGVRSVLLQLPDGLKPWGLAICDYLSEGCSQLDTPLDKGQTGRADQMGQVEVRIYLGDCFGACDLPSTGCDLVVQFGHASWQS